MEFRRLRSFLFDNQDKRLTVGGFVVADGSAGTGLSANIQLVEAISVSGATTVNSLGGATAIVNGAAISGTGNVGTSNRLFNHGFFTNLTGTIQTASQPNITALGNLSAVTVTGAATVNSGNVATAIVNAGSSGVGNIGTSSRTFNTVFAKATSAQYADLAENYLADADYAPGTVVEFGGEFEITLASDETRRVAGVISTNPAYIMNGQLAGAYVLPVALQGRVPCKVRGNIHKGDMLISGGDGYARPTSDPKLGTVIGKALENFEGTDGVIEVVVGRL